jgi:cation transport regulator ChaC
VDTRFRKDALVLIATEVRSYHELQQMIGRSSRTRGICEGILYNIGEESVLQVIDRLKRQNVAALQDLERVLLLLEKKCKDALLIKYLTDERQKESTVRSLHDLQVGLGESVFAKLIRGVFN